MDSNDGKVSDDIQISKLPGGLGEFVTLDEVGGDDEKTSSTKKENSRTVGECSKGQNVEGSPVKDQNQETKKDGKKTDVVAQLSEDAVNNGQMVQENEMVEEQVKMAVKKEDNVDQKEREKRGPQSMMDKKGNEEKLAEVNKAKSVQNRKETTDEESVGLTLYDLVSDISQWENRTAVIYDDGNEHVTLTYHQMMSVADKISTLIELQVKAPNIIGLCINPNQFMPAFLIGVLKNGNAFLNFSTSGLGYVQSVLDQLNVTLLLVQTSNLEALKPLLSQYKMEKIHSDELSHLDIVLIKLYRTEEVRRRGASLAYTITTSGTTGKPKIVRVPHSCIVPNVLYQRRTFEITDNDVVFLCSPLTFDPSIVEIFITLSSGACLLITSDEIKIRPQKLMQTLMKFDVSVMQCTPTLLQRFSVPDLQTMLLGKSTFLRVLGLGGEKFPSLHHLQQWRASGNKTKFFNLYGITEVSCWSSIYQITENDFSEMNEDVPLGQPITDTVFVVKDKEGQVITHGNGYLFIESSTRMCLINDEKEYPGSRPVQRATGDIVSVKADGRIEYIGREDTQIKRHGKRIDLTEIEQIISKEHHVKTAKVLFRDGLLVAAIILRSEFNDVLNVEVENDINTSLKLLIQSYLPSYYWPDDIVFLENLPMTKHGKCDMDELWKTVRRQRNDKSSELLLQNLNIEVYLKQIWKDQLNCKDICLDELFIPSGGDSIKALQLANRIQSDLDMQLPWLLDCILHKPYSENLENLRQELQQHQIEKIKTNNAVSFPPFTTALEKEAYTSEAVKNEILNGVRKRKLDDCDKPNYNLKSTNNEMNDVILNSSAKITCNLRSVSRCNRCSDWSVLRRGLICDFKCYEDFVPSMDFRHAWRSVTKSFDYEYDNVQSCAKSSCIDECKFVLSEIWKYDTGKCVDASPLIASLSDGRVVVYIGSHSHRFSAILLDTGQLLWETTLGDRIESSACLTLCGNYVVFGCYDYKIYALDSKTGDTWWTYETGGEVKSSPVVDPITSLVIFGSHDQKLHAVNIQKQEVAWCININCGSIFASPCVSLEPHFIVSATLGGMVVAVNGESGTLLWKYKCGKPVFSSPTITTTGICFGCVDGCVYQLNVQGLLMWTFTTKGPIFSSPSYVDKKIFIGSHDCHMYCCNASGNFLWKVKVESAVYSSAFGFTLQNQNSRKALNSKMSTEHHFNRNFEKYCSSNCSSIPSQMNGSSIGQSTYHVDSSLTRGNMDNCFVIFASTNGDLFIVEAASGDIICCFKFPGEVFSSPVFYCNYLVVGCRNDFVYCLKII